LSKLDLKTNGIPNLKDSYIQKIMLAVNKDTTKCRIY
jgi:hypothetical protein